MRTCRHKVFYWVLACACALLGAACQSPLGKPHAPRLDSTPTLSAQKTKDAAILDRADAIDTVVAPAPAPLPQAVKHETDAIRAAVKAAPAAEVASLTRALEAQITEIQSQLQATQAKLRQAEERGSTAIKVALFSISSLVCIAGVVIALTGSQIPLFGPRAGFAVASGGVAGFGLAVAYDWATRHPVWTGAIIASFIASAAGLMWANLVAHKEKGVLT